MITKKCFKCEKVKSLDEFYRHPAMADGHLNKCKLCAKKDVSKNYRKRIDHYTKYEKRRWKDPERRAYAVSKQRERRAVNHEKYKARIAVSNGIRSGEIKKGRCSVCGKADAEAHHEDYSKPLSITWLCRSHHLKLHGKRHHADESVGEAKATYRARHASGKYTNDNSCI